MSLELPTLEIGSCEGLPIMLGGMSVGLTEATIAAEFAKKNCWGTIGGVGLGLTEQSRGKRATMEANAKALEQNILNALEESGNGNVGVNLMVATSDYEESVGVAVKNGAKYIATGAGLPLALPGLIMKYAKEYDIPAEKTPARIPIVSSVQAARIIITRWQRNFGTGWEEFYGKPLLPDAIVIENPNTAGGHLGAQFADIGDPKFDFENVIPEMLEYFKANNIDIPIIAAGGIWERADIDKVLLLGASCVQMSTRFIGTKECGGTQEFKDMHINGTDPIVVIKSPVGLPGRARDNEFIQMVKAGEVPEIGPCVGCLQRCAHRDNPAAAYCISRYLLAAHQGEDGLVFTGTNGDRLRENRAVNSSTSLILDELIAGQ